MCWGPEPGSWAVGSHSQGCSVHRSHRQPGGWRRSAVAGCLPVKKRKNRSAKHQNKCLSGLSLVSYARGPHLENFLIKQTGSKHCDAIGVDLRVVAAGQGTGHLLLAVQQQCDVLL